MNFLKKIGGFLVALAVLMGWKYYNKSSKAADYENQLISICGESLECVTAVNQNFNSCYNSHYSMGGKRTAGRLKLEEFTNCINRKSGYNYFEVKKN